MLTRSQLVGPPPGVGSYPFAHGQSRGAVEDLYLYVDRVSATPPVRMEATNTQSSWSAGSTPEFRLYDADNTLLFDTETAVMIATPWGTGFTLYTWRSGYESLWLLANTDEASGLEIPDSAVLDERSWGLARPSIRSIVVNGEEVDAGRIVFEAGYNLDLTPSGNNVTFAAIPGAGAGVVDECVPVAAPLRTISRVGPNDKGEFRLQAKDCIGLSAGENQITIRGDCEECAPCEAYVRVYKALTKIDTLGADQGSRTKDVKDTYTLVVDRWNEQKACRENRPLRTSASAYRSAGVRCAAIVVTFCNVYQQCLVDLTATLDWAVSNPAISGDIVAGSVIIYRQDGRAAVYELGGAWPNWTVGWGAVDPGKSVRLRFSICFTGEVEGDWAQLIATASAAGRPEFATDSLQLTFS